MADHDRYDDAYLADVLKSVETIALVGASAKPERPSHGVMAFLQSKGYRVIPVNPGLAGQDLLGETVYGALADVPGPFQMVDVFRNSEAAGPVTDEAIRLKNDKGITTVWMQIDVRNDDAAARAEDAGLRVVMNRCPKQEIPRLGL